MFLEKPTFTSNQVEEEKGAVTDTYIVSMPHHEMRQTVHRCANSSRRADITAPWQETSRLGKMMDSLTSRLPQAWAPRRVEEYGTKVEALVTAAWKIFGQVSVIPELWSFIFSSMPSFLYAIVPMKDSMLLVFGHLSEMPERESIQWRHILHFTA